MYLLHVFRPALFLVSASTHPVLLTLWMVGATRADVSGWVLTVLAEALPGAVGFSLLEGRFRHERVDLLALHILKFAFFRGTCRFTFFLP